MMYVMLFFRKVVNTNIIIIIKNNAYNPNRNISSYREQDDERIYYCCDLGVSKNRQRYPFNPFRI